MNMKKFICGLLGLVCAGISIACIISGIRALASPAGDMYGIAVLVSLQYFSGAVVALYGSVILLSLSYGTAKRNTLLLTSGFCYLLTALCFGTSLMLLGSVFVIFPSLINGAMCAGGILILLSYGFWRLAGYLWKRATAA